jgi:hypothetical protein
MARGWESKAVESQKDDLQNRIPLPRKSKDAAEREKQKEREGIEIQRRRVARELAATTSSVRRSALEKALQFLDDQLKKQH